MIEAGGGGLNPFEAAAADDFGPEDRDFCMATEDVGFEELGRDAFLAGVDDFVAGGSGADLVEVARVEGVAEDDAHGWVQGSGFRGRRSAVSGTRSKSKIKITIRKMVRSGSKSKIRIGCHEN